MQEVDLNDDGVIDYSEFLTLVKVWLPISFKYYFGYHFQSFVHVPQLQPVDDAYMIHFLFIT